MENEWKARLVFGVLVLVLLIFSLPDTNAVGECTLCGNGIVDTGEQCDDGNLVAGDGCSATCTVEVAGGDLCGDGFPDVGEDCDDGNFNNHDGCSSTCKNEGLVCGDDVLDAIDEQCDDGNTDNDDGCDSSCDWEGVTITVSGAFNTPHTIFTAVDNSTRFRNISDGTDVCKYISTANINVTGELVLEDCILEMNSSIDGQFYLDVAPTGALIINFSNITRGNNQTHQSQFVMRVTGNFSVNNSFISFVGYRDIPNFQGLSLNTSNVSTFHNTSLLGMNITNLELQEVTNNINLTSLNMVGTKHNILFLNSENITLDNSNLSGASANSFNADEANLSTKLLINNSFLTTSLGNIDIKNVTLQNSIFVEPLTFNSSDGLIDNNTFLQNIAPLTITSSHIIVSRNTFINSNISISLSGVLQNITISQNIMSNFTEVGIDILRQRNISIEHNNLTGKNNVSGTTVNAGELANFGVRIRSGDNNDPCVVGSGCTFVNNTIMNVEYGISHNFCFGFTELEIRATEISAFSIAGLFLGNTSTIIKNSLINSTQYNHTGLDIQNAINFTGEGSVINITDTILGANKFDIVPPKFPNLFDNYLINVTFNASKVDTPESGSGYWVQWYLNSSLNSTNNTVETEFSITSTNVTSDDVILDSSTTISENWYNVTEYFNFAGVLTYETPHNFTFHKRAFRRNTTFVNITLQSGGVFTFFVTLQNDSVNPNTTIHFPENNTDYEDSTLDFNFTIFDTMDVESCWYRLENETTENITITNCFVNLSGVNALQWSVDYHNITLGANDTAGNYANDTKINFSVSGDTTTPNITSFIPANGSSSTGGLGAIQIVNLSVTDNEALDGTCIFNKLTSENTRTTNRTFSVGTSCDTNFTVTLNYHGIHRVDFIVNDTSNNIRTQQLQFTYNAPAAGGGGGGGGPTTGEPEIVEVFIFSSVCGNNICESNETDSPFFNETIISCSSDCKILKEFQKGNFAAFPRFIVFAVLGVFILVGVLPGRKIRRRIRTERKSTKRIDKALKKRRRR